MSAPKTTVVDMVSLQRAIERKQAEDEATRRAAPALRDALERIVVAVGELEGEMISFPVAARLSGASLQARSALAACVSPGGEK